MSSLPQTFLYGQLKTIFGEENLHLIDDKQDMNQDYTYIPVKKGVDIEGWIGIGNEKLTVELQQLIHLLCHTPGLLFSDVDDEEVFWQKAIQDDISSWKEDWDKLPYPSDMLFGIIFVSIDKTHEHWNFDTYQQFKELVEGVLEERSYLLALTQKQLVWILPRYDAIKEEIEELLKGLVDTLASEFMVDTRFYIGEPYSMPTELNSSVQYQHKVIQACESIRLRKNVVFIHNITYLYLIKQSSPFDRKQYVQRILGSVIYDTEMIETIRVYFEENLNTSETAKKLFIHRNSMQYRLEKFYEKTGFDLRKFEQAVMVYIALQALGMMNKE